MNKATAEKIGCFVGGVIADFIIILMFFSILFCLYKLTGSFEIVVLLGIAFIMTKLPSKTV